MFQFQTGAIKRDMVLIRFSVEFPGFNSKLVRLKVSRLRHFIMLRALFQFQTGAIKSPYGLSIIDPAMLSFNSKLVRLKASSTSNPKSTLLSFNSKLVRLKVGSQPILQGRNEFQFQTGAIKSSARSDHKPISAARFNSKLVRLKGEVACVEKVAQPLVSIPNWCD